MDGHAVLQGATKACAVILPSSTYKSIKHKAQEQITLDAYAYHKHKDLANVTESNRNCANCNPSGSVEVQHNLG